MRDCQNYTIVFHRLHMYMYFILNRKVEKRKTENRKEEILPLAIGSPKSNLHALSRMAFVTLRYTLPPLPYPQPLLL